MSLSVENLLRNRITMTDDKNTPKINLCDAMKIVLDNPDILTVNILRNWSREKRIKFAKHLLGDIHEL